MVIQELKPSRRAEGRWLAVLEDGSILRLGEGEVVAFALYAGKELSDEEAEALTAAARRSQWKEKALSLLSVKSQSRGELERRLEQWGASGEEADAICARLEELGYLDDRAYAARVVAWVTARGCGARKARDELYRCRVPRELWDEALEQAPDSAGQIDRFLAAKLHGRAPEEAEKRRLTSALLRRGFTWGDVREAWGRLGAAMPEE